MESQFSTEEENLSELNVSIEEENLSVEENLSIEEEDENSTQEENTTEAIPPTITLNGEENVSIILGNPYVELGAVAVDANESNLTVEIHAFCLWVYPIQIGKLSYLTIVLPMLMD